MVRRGWIRGIPRRMARPASRKCQASGGARRRGASYLDVIASAGTVGADSAAADRGQNTATPSEPSIGAVIRSGAGDDFADLDAVDRDGIAGWRVRSDHLRPGSRRLFG